MEVSVENSDGLERRLKVQIPSDRVEQAVREKIRKVGQHAKIPGFRPGKVPLKVLYQRYGDGARAEVANELIQESYPEALKQEELNPAGQPKVDMDSFEQGKPLEFTATFDVYPDIALQGLDSIEVRQPETEITDADIDHAVEHMREHYKTYEEVERASQDGDRVVVDYVGRIDGEEFAGGSGSDIEVDLGEERFLPDLERALVGRKAGEEFEVPVDFPEDYGAEDVAGKSALFAVSVESVSEAKLPEIDDDFLNKAGIEEGGGEAALREKLAESLRKQADGAIDNDVKNQIMEAVHRANPIDVPNATVANEIQSMRSEAMSRMGQQMQLDEAQAKQLFTDEALREQAERRVALGLLISEVITERGLELDPQRLDAKLDELVGDGEQADQIKQYYRSNAQLMQGLEAMIMEEQVVDSLLDGAKVTAVKKTFDELVNSPDE